MEVRKKSKFKKKLLIVLIVTASASAAAVLFFALLFHKPSSYKPLDMTGSKEVSVYLTHELMPELYNGAQLEEPFDLVVSEEGINDIVARLGWPQDFGSVIFTSPMVSFNPGGISLMGTVKLEAAEFIVTVKAAPGLDNKGLMNMNVGSVEIGAVDITPLAAVLARRMSEAKMADKGPQTKDLWAKIEASLLDGKPFEPVFKVEDKKVRVEKITIEKEKLTVRLTPAAD